MSTARSSSARPYRFVSAILFAVMLFSLLECASLAQERLITQPIDESQLTTLKGNTHPLARPEFDLGTAPATLPMSRMLLVLKRSPAQETALRALLDNQQDKHSPSYHKWLTPQQFGEQFGPTDADIQTISGWLQSHGFQVGTTKGRSVLEFSGSASQVQETFHTPIHKYIVNGEQHWANANDPKIPTALVPAVKGVLTLHNFVSKPTMHYDPKPVPVIFTHGKRPYVTFPAQNGQPATYALGPQDYATIYNINPVYQSNVTGYGITIGVVGRSDLYGQDSASDVLDFRNNFGVPNPPQIILSGPDPGFNSDDAFEATLDVTWSGAVAQQANIDFVIAGSTNTTDGIDLSEAYIVENNLADIMTESFGSCEYANTDARIAGVNAMAEQAAAQGITYFVSTGDSGAEGCDDPNSETVATGPISVNMLASTPFNVAVGGSIFNENGDYSLYWSDASPLAETAISYIPEDVWNESCQTSTCASIWAGGGGASAGNIGDTTIGGTTAGIPKPSWQSGVNGTQNDAVRDLPDVVLTAASHDPYLLCFEGSCEQDEIYFVYGTSAASPSFAGIMALIENNVANTIPLGQSWRQGQANYVLYPLAAAQQSAGTACNASNTPLPNSACVFNDVTVGNNAVPGEIGYPTGPYSAAVGYDLASGLGSVNVANLVNNWSTVTFNPTTTTLTLNGSATNTVTITHGQSVSVAATVAPSSGTATPTGNVALLTSSQVASTLDLFPLSGGQAIGSTSNLPGSGGTTYGVWAQYSGDGTYAPSSSGSVKVIVNAEPSKTTLSLQAYNLLNGSSLTSPYPFGSLVYVSAVVAGNSGQGIPTGTVTFSDTFGPLPSNNAQINPPVQVLSNPLLNSQGNAVLGDAIISFDAGNHTISATYGGDPSFNASSSAQSVSFTIQPGFAFVSLPPYVTITAPGSSGTAAAGIIASTNFTTAVTLTCSGLPAGATCGSATVTGQGPTTVATTNIVISTTAATASRANAQRASLMAVPLTLPLAAIVLVAVPRRRVRLLLLASIVSLLLLAPACGGGGGASSGSGGNSGGQQTTATPAGTYTITVNATAGSLSQSGQFSLVVQ